MDVGGNYPIEGDAKAEGTMDAGVMSSDVVWISAGQAFDVDDIVYYEAKGRRPLDDVLAEIDLVVTGPHASAAFPEEMAPFVDKGLTRRLQFDFTDVSTSPVGQRWASIDPHVLYVENPHPRAVRDANRPRPADLGAVLREAFGRLRSAGETQRPSLTGVDAVRPPIGSGDREWLAFPGVIGIAERHGGSVAVASQLGRGTTFTFRMPLADPLLSPTPAVGS